MRDIWNALGFIAGMAFAAPAGGQTVVCTGSDEVDEDVVTVAATRWEGVKTAHIFAETGDADLGGHYFLGRVDGDRVLGRYEDGWGSYIDVAVNYRTMKAAARSHYGADEEGKISFFNEVACRPGRPGEGEVPGPGGAPRPKH